MNENKCMAREGIRLMLNNKFDEAEELFSAEDDNIQMAAGNCFLTFINALMTFEEDKLEESLQTLRNIEKRCSQDGGWLKSMKNKVFGTLNYSGEDLAKKLEEQIILADSQLCVALLTFLQQDLTSYVRGGWVLRKAWKVYQSTYSQILNLYKKTFGDDAHVPGSQFPSWQVVTKSGSHNSLASSSSSLSKDIASSNTLSSGSNVFQNSLSYIASFALSYDDNKVTVEPYVVSRLMAAVSFGYGIFQLCISLLPSSMLRLIHFLGFEGDRRTALSALKFSKEGNDIRGPLASLALLWYHTIVRPFFALDFGLNIQDGIDEAETLINESLEEFGDSALFLFFKGRVQRLKSNIPQALEAYESAIDKSSQREIQLICLHEIGWCYLIQLDWGNAFHCFNQLSSKSKWSRSFYTYLAAVCIGAYGDIDYTIRLAEEIPNLLDETNGETQIKVFISRRIIKFPLSRRQGQSSVSCVGDGENYFLNKLSCKLLIFELLYFWNALPSCDASSLQSIVEDCRSCEKEPMPGLCSLIEGAAHISKSDFQKAITSFKKCLEKRKDINSNNGSNADDNTDHISAFALLELATIFLRSSETAEEGRNLLTKAQNDYKGYDFENRFSIRLHSININKET